MRPIQRRIIYGLLGLALAFGLAFGHAATHHSFGSHYSGPVIAGDDPGSQGGGGG